MGKSVIITPEEAKRGIYIDFEGFGKQKCEKLPLPHLLGCVVGKEKHAFLLQEKYAPVARSSSIAEWNTLEVASIDDAVEQLYQRAKKEKRLILAYSVHELNAVKRHCREAISKNFSKSFINAKSVAETWRNKCHGRHKPEGNTLKGYFKLIDHDTGIEEGFKMTSVLKSMDKELDKTKCWRNIDKHVKSQWVTLLEYNYQDCKGLRKLTVKAANGLAAKLKGRSQR